jgi:hypothetical protein
MRGGRATVYTVTSRRYFPGTVALFNSLRLTGHSYPFVALDAGLKPEQRRLLEPHCVIFEVPDSARSSPLLWKAFPKFLRPAGVVLVLDSDMIVTDSLEPVVVRAERGEICAVLDPDKSRWHAEWQTYFDLGESLRREPYVNSGFLAFSTSCWPLLLQRWWTACQRIPSERVVPGRKLRGAPPNAGADPIANGDQDALNALLMSEAPPGSVTVLPQENEAFVWDLPSLRLVDEASLRCAQDGHRKMLVHCNGDPKPWEWRAWPRIRAGAYIRLFVRSSLHDDVCVQLPRGSVPIWLRQGVASRVALATLETTHHLAHRVLRALQSRVEAPVRAALGKVTRWS